MRVVVACAKKKNRNGFIQKRIAMPTFGKKAAVFLSNSHLFDLGCCPRSQFDLHQTVFIHKLHTERRLEVGHYARAKKKEATTAFFAAS